jgi:hypothetical protein
VYTPPERFRVSYAQRPTVKLSDGMYMLIKGKGSSKPFYIGKGSRRRAWDTEGRSKALGPLSDLMERSGWTCLVPAVPRSAIVFALIVVSTSTRRRKTVTWAAKEATGDAEGHGQGLVQPLDALCFSS